MKRRELIAHFERLYAARADPWDYRTSRFERAKYDDTLRQLGGRRFRRALDAGCSIGVFTRRLAAHAAEVVAMDVVADAVRRAGTGAPSNVTFETGAVPEDWPAGTFDLVVLSEILYYLAPPERAETAERLARSLEDGGMVVAVNWLGATGTPWTGDEAASAFAHDLRGHGLTVRTRRREGYRLDLFARG